MMNKIIHLIGFSVIIGVCLSAKYRFNGVPVLINQYKYDIPVHHTPPKVRYNLPYPYPYPPQTPSQPHEIYGLPEVVAIEIPQEAPPVPHDSYGVPIGQEVVTAREPEQPAVLIEEVKDEPIKTNYNFKIPATPEPVKDLDCDDEDILIPEEPVHEEKKPITTNYAFTIPLKESVSKTTDEAVPYPPATGKPALVYGVPDNLPIIVVN